MADLVDVPRSTIESVYHSLEAVLNVLEKPEYCTLPEVQQLLSTFHSVRESCKKHPEPTTSGTCENFPFIVFEGIDGTGKTTLIERLSATMSVVRNPPQCLVCLRDKFDSHGTQLRRAYYALGNYISANQVSELRRQKPVVMDRYWQSTAAYALATEVLQGQGSVRLPPEGDPVYDWPRDLLRPDLVLLLHVAEDVRNRRLSRRATVVTAEERVLKSDIVFRHSLMEAYKRMRDPAAVQIDNSHRSVEDVVAEIKDIIGRLTGETVVEDGIRHRHETATSIPC